MTAYGTTGKRNLAEFLDGLKVRMEQINVNVVGLEEVRKGYPETYPIWWKIFNGSTKPLERHHWIHQDTMTGQDPYDLSLIAQQKGIDIRYVEWNQSLIPHNGGHTEVSRKSCVTELNNALKRLWDTYGKDMNKWTIEAITGELQEAVKTIKQNIENGSILLYID